MLPITVNVNHLVQNFFTSDSNSVQIIDLQYQRVVGKAEHEAIQESFRQLARPSNKPVLQD